MKISLYALTFYTLCLPTAHKAMDISRALSTSTLTKNAFTVKPLTKEYCTFISQDIKQKWPLFEKKQIDLAKSSSKKIVKDNCIFTPLFAVIPPTPRHVEDNKLVQEIRAVLKEKWPLVEKKWLDMACTEYVQPLEQQLQELSTLKPEDLDTLQKLINMQISLNDPELTFETKEKMLKKGLLVATTSAGLLALQHQHVVDPLVRLMYPTRNPFALAGAGLSLLDASKKTLVTIAGISLVYIGANKVVNSFTSWAHSSCEKEKEEAIKNLTATFLQEVTKLKKDFTQEITELKKEMKEMDRAVGQARENAFKSFLEYDKLEKSTNTRIKDYETAQKHTEAEVIGMQRDIAKLRKQLYEEIEKVRRHYDDALKSKLNSLKKQIEAVQDKVKNFSKGDQTATNNEAFAILSQELQKLGEDMRQIAPSQSRRSSLAPSDTGTYTSRAPLEQDSRPASPVNSLYSIRSEAGPRHRPLSQHQPVSKLSTNQYMEDFLNKITEEHLSDKHSSPESSEKNIRISPPTPPKNSAINPPDEIASSSYQQPSITTTHEVDPISPVQKTPSPRRRKSVCFGIFGKKEPKDTHDPRE
jgi:hypothetical protein